eukprot:scaffold323457_cov86-Attheya_sp.AAC.3
MPPTIAAVPQFVLGVQTYTPPQPTVAVAVPLGTTVNCHRHSKPILGYLDDNPPEPHYHNRIDCIYGNFGFENVVVAMVLGFEGL